MRIIAFQREVLLRKSEEVFLLRVDAQFGKCARFPGQLGIDLFLLVEVGVSIARHADQFKALVVETMGQHLEDETIACDIEGTSEIDIPGPHVEHQTDQGLASLHFRRVHEDLKGVMARHQGALLRDHVFIRSEAREGVHIGVVGRNQMTAPVRVVLQVVEQFAQLVDVRVVVGFDPVIKEYFVLSKSSSRDS